MDILEIDSIKQHKIHLNKTELNKSRTNLFNRLRVSMNSVPNFPKLVGTENYLVWRERIKGILFEEKLLKHISSRKEFINQKEEDERLNCTYKIRANIEDNVLIKVLSIEDPLELWNKLENLYCKLSQDDINDLIDKLEIIKLSDKNGVVQYVERLEKIFFKMKNAGFTKSEKEKINILIKGLPKTSKFEMISIQISGLENATFDNAIRTLKTL